MLASMTTSRASIRSSNCRRLDGAGHALSVFEANGHRSNFQKRDCRPMTKESEDKKEQRVREGAQAWADYQAEGRALRPSNDARLRNPTTTSALIRAGTGGTNPQSGECP